VIRTVCLAFLVLGLAACSSDDGGATGPEGTSFAGVYSLISVDGDPIPILILEDANEKSECTGGTLTLMDGADVYSGTFTASYHFRFEQKVQGTVHNNVQDMDGTWERQGSSLTFDDDGDTQPEATATVSGNRLTLTGNDDGISQVWEK